MAIILHTMVRYGGETASPLLLPEFGNIQLDDDVSIEIDNVLEICGQDFTG